MLKYEIVSILRNKAAYIFLLVVLLFGLKATVELQRSITSSQDTNYIKRELQYELVMHEMQNGENLIQMQYNFVNGE